MTSDQASMKNQRLPKGFVYVPIRCLSNEKEAVPDACTQEQLNSDEQNYTINACFFYPVGGGQSSSHKCMFLPELQQSASETRKWQYHQLLGGSKLLHFSIEINYSTEVLPSLLYIVKGACTVGQLYSHFMYVKWPNFFYQSSWFIQPFLAGQSRSYASCNCIHSWKALPTVRALIVGVYILVVLHKAVGAASEDKI